MKVTIFIHTNIVFRVIFALVFIRAVSFLAGSPPPQPLALLPVVSQPNLATRPAVALFPRLLSHCCSGVGAAFFFSTKSLWIGTQGTLGILLQVVNAS